MTKIAQLSALIVVSDIVLFVTALSVFAMRKLRLIGKDHPTVR